MLPSPSTHTTPKLPKAQTESYSRLYPYALLLNPNIHTGALLLFIACTLIALPEMPERTKSVLLVAFACVAMIRRL